MSSKCEKNLLDLFCVPLSEDIPQCTEEFKKSFRVVDKGSLTLRSKEHAYSDGVLKNNWFIEDRPKDFDFRTACPRSLHRSTYRRLGCSRDPTPLTVYGFTNEEMFKLHSIPPPPIRHRDPSNLNDRQCIMIERDGAVADASGNQMVLPRHSEDPKKFYALTTNWDTYRPQLPYLVVSRAAEDLIKEHEEEVAMEFITACNKKCVSQFTDLNGTKTQGTNNWRDESGIYANSSLRIMNSLYTRKEPPFSTRLV